jgi:nicotinamidase/pyrazinamidase
MPEKPPTAALLMVDVQNDFCPGGALPVPEGDRVLPVLNDGPSALRGGGAADLCLARLASA